MSLISTGLLFTHLATVERDTTATTNGWGQTGAPNWQPHISSLACRFWTQTGEERADATTTAVVEDMRLLAALGTDVTERDRLSDITDKLGVVIAAGPIGIRAVMQHQDHLELILVRIA